MKILSLSVCRVLVLTVCLLLTACSPSAVPPQTGSSLTVAFSPQGTSLELVLSCVQTAERDILVAAYSFTSKPIATALLDAHKRGVTVQVVADKKGNSSQYTATPLSPSSPIRAFRCG